MSTQFAPPVAPPAAPQRASKGILIASYAMALLMPLIGFILGIVLMFKNRMGHGIAVLAISALAFTAYLSLALNDASNDLNRSLNTPALTSPTTTEAPTADAEATLTAAEVVDTMPADTVQTTCDLIESAADMGLSDSDIYAGFKKGYGTDENLPSARAVWTELKSRC